jgi:response regulator RpfG family c-di-GMP phosphodiesterase
MISGLMTAGVWVAALSFLGILIRQIGPWKQQTAEVEQRLRDDLIRRLEKVERTLDSERAIHKAERSLDRHRLNNVTQCFDALLLLIEMAPERATEAVQKIKEMRSTQLRAESEEKALIRAAEIAAADREAEAEIA